MIRGGTTTKSFLLSLLDRPEVVAGTADTAWLDRTGTSGGADPERHAAIALIQVAIDVSDAEEALERAAFLASARGGRPRASHDVGRVVELGYRGQAYKLTVAKVDPDRYRVGLDGSHVDVDVDRLSALESRLTIGDERFSVVASARRHVAPGRGRRRHPPRHPRRGGRGARPGARRRRRRPGRASGTTSRPARRSSSSRA